MSKDYYIGGVSTLADEVVPSCPGVPRNTLHTGIALAVTIAAVVDREDVGTQTCGQGGVKRGAQEVGSSACVTVQVENGGDAPQGRRYELPSRM